MLYNGKKSIRRDSVGEFVIMLRNVLIFVALAIPGYLLVKGKLLKPEQSGVYGRDRTEHHQ